MTDAIFAPHAMHFSELVLDVLGAELVVDQPEEGDAVAENLAARDGVAEEGDGGNDEEDVLDNS